MDVENLSIHFLKGYEGAKPLPDGYTQTDKRLPYFSVACPLQGYYRLGIEDKPLETVPQGGCFLVPPFVRHTLVHHAADGSFYDQWLYFSVLWHNVLDVTAWFHSPHILQSKDAAPLREILQELLSLPEDSYARAFSKMQIAGKLLQCLLEISEFHPTELQPQRIYPAISLIHKNFSAHLSVEDMANACQMSPSSFYRTFRGLTQQTPMQYLTSHRLRHAAGLLIAQPYTLAEIASRCGFCDEFHLSRTFKNCYGVSPREYKRRHSD